MVDELIAALVETTAAYLTLQAASGADALKLFDSWSEGLPEDQFERLVTRPHAEIVKRLRAAGVKLPVIGFPRGAGALVEGYAARAGVDCIALDVQERPYRARAPQRDLIDLALAAAIGFAVSFGFALFILSTRP